MSTSAPYFSVPDTIPERKLAVREHSRKLVGYPLGALAFGGVVGLWVAGSITFFVVCVLLGAAAAWWEWHTIQRLISGS